jgi:hypothetical protein
MPALMMPMITTRSAAIQRGITGPKNVTSAAKMTGGTILIDIENPCPEEHSLEVGLRCRKVRPGKYEPCGALPLSTVDPPTYVDACRKWNLSSCRGCANARPQNAFFVAVSNGSLESLFLGRPILILGYNARWQIPILCRRHLNGRWTSSRRRHPLHQSNAAIDFDYPRHPCRWTTVGLVGLEARR